MNKKYYIQCEGQLIPLKKWIKENHQLIIGYVYDQKDITHRIEDKLEKLGWISIYDDDNHRQILTNNKPNQVLKHLNGNLETSNSRLKDSSVKLENKINEFNNLRTNMLNSINQFFQSIIKQPIELYSEAGLQHELALFLRNNFPDFNVRLEYPTTRIYSPTPSFVKKEIDIYITTKSGEKYVIELKMPKESGGTPKEMYHAIEDVKFLEQLRHHNMDGCYAVLMTKHVAFWQTKRADSQIYKIFNGETVNFQTLTKEEFPTFLKNSPEIQLSQTYQAKWNDIVDIHNNYWKYYVLEV